MKLTNKKKNYRAVAIAAVVAARMIKFKLRKNRIWIPKKSIRNLKEIKFQ